MAMTLPERRKYFKKDCGKFPELLIRNYVNWGCHPLQEAGWPILPLPVRPNYHSDMTEALRNKDFQNMENTVQHRPKSQRYNQE